MQLQAARNSHEHSQVPGYMNSLPDLSKRTLEAFMQLISTPERKWPYLCSKAYMIKQPGGPWWQHRILAEALGDPWGSPSLPGGIPWR